MRSLNLHVIYAAFIMAVAVFAAADMGYARTQPAAVVAYDAYIKKPVPGARAAGGYVVIKNNLTMDNALVAAESDIAEAVELHTMSMDGDIMRMRKVEKMPIIGGEELVLSRDTGDHLMFINPKTDLADGDIVDVTLRFENGAMLKAKFTVVSSFDDMAGGADDGDVMDHDREHNHMDMHHDHDDMKGHEGHNMADEKEEMQRQDADGDDMHDHSHDGHHDHHH